MEPVVHGKRIKIGVIEMQLKLGENADGKRKEMEQQRLAEEKQQKKKEERQRFFKENFRLGSTNVLKHKGVFYFWGDIAHCGRENIFFNARKIKSMMETNGHTMGHMAYDDPPTFSSTWAWKQEEKERKLIYRDDLYKFEGDNIVIAELIDKEPIGHIYPTVCSCHKEGEKQETDTEIIS